MQPGLAGYPGQYGNALIRKENLDKFIYTMKNKPVVINHQSDITDDDKVGEVMNVWFNPKDGWYWCDGVIWDETAQNLITDKEWSVSCSYNYTKYNDEGGTENNIPYDIEFLDGEFTHLAIVDNPRYERANIVFNSKVDNGSVILDKPDEDNIQTDEDNNEDFKEKHNANQDVDNEREQNMALLEELKKLISNVENDKGASMDEGKKVNNKDVDKRELLREADAIAMKPVSDFKGGEEEKFRTLTKLMEEIGYNKSSRGTADNEVKSDEEGKEKKDEKKADELKKDVKEDVENKCKDKVDNSKPSFFDRLNEVYNSAIDAPVETGYVSREEQLNLAKEYFS